MDGNTRVKTIRLDDGDAWCCENGHVMGVKRRERISRKHKGYRLYLLRDTLEEMPAPLTPLAWRGRVEGTMRNIQCDCCDAEKTWWANKAAMDSLSGKTGAGVPSIVDLVSAPPKCEEPAVRIVPVIGEAMIRRQS